MTPPVDRDTPLTDAEIACLAVMADMGSRASPATLRRLLTTIRTARRELRRLEATIAELITRPRTR